MKRVIFGRAVLGVGLAGLCAGALAQERPERPRQSDEPATQTRQANEPEPQGGKDAAVPIPPEKTSVTQHVWSAGGRSLHYTATAGNLLIRDENDKANGSIFYAAYTQDDVPGAGEAHYVSL